jgi:penicillin-binding protein 2
MATSMMPDDRRSLTLRLSFMQYSVAFGFATLAVAFWIFQIAQHERFREIADSQYMQRLPLPAPRGGLFDRSLQILVENTTTFNVALVREQVKDVDRTLRLLADATGEDVEQFREAVNRRRRDPSYRPIVLIDNAAMEQVIAVRARKSELPGIIYQQVPTRKYTMSHLAAHLFGYVGEVREEQLARAEYEGVEAGTVVGQSGVEQIYNRLLMGIEGSKEVIVNSVGREIEQVAQHDPKEGKRLQLTIDLDLQKAAEDGFRHFGEVQSGGPYNGAAVVLDPRSGDVLSLVSLPAYDPNRFAVGIDAATWKSLNTDPLRPLNNRALQGRYSPGSTFKIVVATAALEEGVATPATRVYCTGGGVFHGRYFQCWKKGGHGSVDMRQGIEQSCNVYFYTLGNQLGIDRLHKWAANLGLADRTGIDLPNEVQSIMPSTEWKQRVHKEKWYAGETISVAIGQGYVSVTPLSLATMMMTVANGGTRYTPHVLRAVDDGQGWKPVPPPAPKSTVRMKDSTVQALHDGLWMVINAAGTGGRARLAGRDISGKTGTAQPNMSLETQRRLAGRLEARDHGWFVFFAPRDNPELAGAVFTEHSEHGYYGGPIVKHIVDTYYAKKEGRPLPVLVKPSPTTIVAENAPPRPRPAGQNRQP